MGLYEDVASRVRSEQGLTLERRKGAGALGWEPVDAAEAKRAELVVIHGPECFGALCRLGGAIRYLGGLRDDQPVSREWPSGETTSIDEAVKIAVELARARLDHPPGK